MDRDKLIQKYLHAELTPDEYETFLNLSKSDPEFAEEVNIQSVFYANRSKALKDILNAKQDTNLDDQEVVNKKQTKQLFLIVRNIAAIFILGLTSYFLFSSINPKSSTKYKELANSYALDKHAPPFITMNNEIALDDPWKVAIEAYRTNQYDLVIDQISKIENRSNEQTLYLALSHMYTESPNLDISINLFKDLISNKTNLHKDEPEWFLSLAYLENGELEKARTLLQNIIAEKSWNHKKAMTLFQLLPKE